MKPRRRRVSPASIKAGVRACGIMDDRERAACFFQLGQQAERAAARSRSPKKLRGLATELKARAEAVWGGGTPVASRGRLKRRRRR